MAKITWAFQDEKGTNLNRYIATNVATGEEITFDLLRGGNISIVGTPLNAETLNSLIAAINELYDKDSDINNEITDINNEITNINNEITKLQNTDVAFEDRLEILEGNHLYEHNISINAKFYATRYNLGIRILNNSITPLDSTSYKRYLPQNDGELMPVNGFEYFVTDNTSRIVIFIQRTDGKLMLYVFSGEECANLPYDDFGITELNDYVRQIY